MRLVASLVGTVLAVSGAVALGAALVGQEPAPPRPSEATRTAGSDPGGAGHQAAVGAADDPSRPSDARSGAANGAGRSGGTADAATTELGWSRPVRVTIPAIGVSSGLEALGLDSRGVMQAPQDPARVGWFTPAPPPGVPGAAVLAGHVTWNQAPAVFFRLGDLRRGDRIRVRRADGTVAVFAVSRLGEFPKQTFPTRAVYHQIDHAGLRLITCGGTYDAESHSYRSNLIVWARMTATHRARVR